MKKKQVPNICQIRVIFSISFYHPQLLISASYRLMCVYMLNFYRLIHILCIHFTFSLLVIDVSFFPYHETFVKRMILIAMLFPNMNVSKVI